MKLKCTITGQIWDVDYIAASQGDRVANFYRDYELIPDEPTPSTEIGTLDRLVARDVIELSASHMRLTERVKNLEANNATSTLLNQHDAILLDHAGCIGSLQEDTESLRQTVEKLISTVEKLLGCVEQHGANNTLLANRINTLEFKAEQQATRDKSAVWGVVDSHWDQITQLIADNQRLNDRLNAIEGNWK